MQRRLAAILAADIVGYSRLMEADETGTVLRLRSLFQQVVRPAVSGAGGRIVKLMGDGMLAEFCSAVDAVGCAAGLQQTITELELTSARERRLHMRIGVNLGDVISQDGDIFGDGVNIAARLEALADPGGVLISGSVFDTVDGKAGLQFEAAGERTLKNINRPVRLYHLQKNAKAKLETVRRKSPPHLSLAVLPFDNMSGDADRAYFSDGVTEDVITELSHVPGLFVAARNASFAWRGKVGDRAAVSRALNVRYLLEGSLRHADGRVRITAQLIDGLTGGHVWAERFDRDMSGVFEIQDEISTSIVRAVRAKLGLDTPDAQLPAARQPSVSVSAYDKMLRARHLGYQFTRESNLAAIALFEEVVAEAPDFGPAHAGLALTVNTGVLSGWVPDKERARAMTAARQAVALDPGDALARRSLAVTLLWNDEYDSALHEINTAVALASDVPVLLALRGYILSYGGSGQEAVDDLETAIRMDISAPPLWQYFLGHAHFVNENYPEAVVALEDRLRRDPGTDITRALLASCYGHLGAPDKARQSWHEMKQINPQFSLTERRSKLPYQDGTIWDRLISGLSAAGITD